MSRQAERSEATRTVLIAAARALFAERGYAGVGTVEIVERAGSSRGAMYHHFKDKKELFRAVYEQVQEEIVARIGAAMGDAGDDPIAALRTGLRVFLDTCLERDKARIGLVDAPAVLGWETWREIDERYALGLVTAGLEQGRAAGVLRTDVPLRPLAHMVLASLAEAGLLIAGSDDPETARREALPAVLAFLDGLRA
ncbi:TetR/AcrR family transcriptional regulator [Actinomadura rayongensis]|uniref:TetR family transcriptional regulator n=1 Tax=Actinomadura rayongensis TaxID=1429076 RepID=A0A6I4WFV9_9ACTN|nr:TetR/AcrR family transcriptional regulator [Actinomadura rayongensis]MXQ65874.1 TetR family transcriptional regulator [Actinomadura rayongensis]